MSELIMLEGGRMIAGQRYSAERRYIAIGQEGVWRPVKKLGDPETMHMHQIQDLYSIALLRGGWTATKEIRVYPSNKTVRMSAQHHWHPTRFNYFRLEYWSKKTEKETT